MPHRSLVIALVLVSLLLALWPVPARTLASSHFGLLQTSGVNVALTSNGGVATASSTVNSDYPASAANNGDRKGLNWGAGGGWSDGTYGIFPDWLEVDFAMTEAISEIDVFTLQDNYASPSDPTLAMTSSVYGITAFSVQYWDGANWVSVPGGDVTGNNNVWRKFTFTPITTGKIRVYITNCLAGYSRLTELEAWTPSQPPTVSVTSPSNGAAFTAPANITINATAADSDGTVSKVEFFQGSTKLGESTASPYSYQWNGVAVGSYTLTAKATDNSGATTTSSAVNISVNPPGATIAGRVTRTDGTTAIAGVAVSALQGTTVSGSAATDANGNYSVTGLGAGTYSVQASAAGYTSQTQSGIAATSGGTTTVNFNLDAPINYVYDELGRLVGVVDQGGQAAVYSYDSVGNLLSISRLAPSHTGIIRFSPASGPIGTTVTVYGTGFSTTASQNTVTFNGTAATVISSSPSQIATSVPGGATTGPITVTSPAGSATSSASFTVGSASGAPTITGFTPAIGVLGSAVTITGTNFDTVPFNDRTVFNVVSSTVSSATSTSIAATVPPAGSGRISVTTPNGTAVSTSDFFIPPAGYAATDVVFTGRMAIGTSATATINTAGKIGLMLFDGAAGQQVSMALSNVTVGAYVTVYSPDGTVLVSATPVGSGSFFTPVTLPATGTYTILISPGSPSGPQTGSLTFTLYNAPDVTGTITPGGAAVTATTTTPGQVMRLKFSGTAGQRVSLQITSNTVPVTSTVYINNPNGSRLFSTGVGYVGQFVDPQTLPVTGTYTILFVPDSTNTGSATFALYSVVDVTGSISPSGPAVTVAITTPGQNALLTFSGAAGQRVSLNVTAVTINANTVVSILKPDGTALASATSFGTSGTFIDATTLPVAGTYTILVDPPTYYTGNATLNLYDLPDVTGTISAGGPAVTVTIPNPGQVARITFSGTLGDRVSLRITSVTIGNTTAVSLLKPDGTTLATFNANMSAGGWLDPTTLPVTGTYTILIDPSGSSTGNMTLNLYGVVDISGSITPSGASVTAMITTPGQNAIYTFTGTAGHRISLNITGVTINANTPVSVLKPDGTTLAGATSFGTSGAFIDATSLPVSGTYSVLVDPPTYYTGNMTLALYDVPADTTGAITIGGASVTVACNTPGQDAQLTFSGTSGQQVTVNLTGNTMGAVTVKLLNPDGSTLTYGISSASSFSLSSQTLPASGTYTITIDLPGANTGSMTVSLTSP